MVIILLVAKKYLSPSGKVNVTINGKNTVSVEQGGNLLSTLSEQGIYLPSAWVVRVAVANVSARLLKAVVKSLILNADISRVSR